MHGAFQVAVSPLDHAVAEVDDGTARLGLDVLPVLFEVGVADGEDL